MNTWLALLGAEALVHQCGKAGHAFRTSLAKTSSAGVIKFLAMNHRSVEQCSVPIKVTFEGVVAFISRFVAEYFAIADNFLKCRLVPFLCAFTKPGPSQT